MLNAEYFRNRANENYNDIHEMDNEIKEDLVKLLKYIDGEAKLGRYSFQWTTYLCSKNQKKIIKLLEINGFKVKCESLAYPNYYTISWA